MEDRKTDWEPTTRLGRMVKNGEISSLSEALRSGHPLKESEIVDVFLTEMGDEVLDVHMVQRMTDSGRRVQFLITCVVGNENGFVGLGTSKGKEVGFTIRKAIENAKVNLIEVKRGCGSWECGCMTPHTFPFAVTGKSSSVVVKFKPAPRGIGLAVGNVAKHILRLAGIEDAWVFTSGQTQTTTNYARAVFSALQKATEMRVTPGLEKELKIQNGPIEVVE
ncbi:MAG: 30S ribosomal protein S5 [Deltaproteobacteria bacterium]|nr:30S ribosomal protein S5 [Deltaproteobacteria bacterium]